MTAILLAAAALAALVAAPVTRVTVRPMPAPEPALKYQLLPEVRELKAGNAAQWYLRCFMEQRAFFFSKESVAQRARYRSMTLKELAREGLQNYGGSALTQADWGARLDTVDWQVLDRVQAEGPDLRLPELAPLHLLAVSLQIRFRGEVAQGDFDSAVRTAKTMFGLARHLGDYPTSSAAALGQKVADLALDALWEMVQQPDCPNLFWALTDLPAPLVDLRRGAQGDRTLADTELRGLRDDGPLTDAQADELIGRLSGRVGHAREQVGLPPRNLRAAFLARAKDPDGVAATRLRLIGAGLGKNTVSAFSPVQVLLLGDRYDYECARDEQLKLLGLKVWELDAPAPGRKTRTDGLFADLLPNVAALRRAQGRFDQRVALLRHVEALRMFAALHGGTFPNTLAEIGLPLPEDPFTGKPFVYALDGPTATLSGAAPKGEDNTPSLRYEVTLVKPERTQK